MPTGSIAPRSMAGVFLGLAFALMLPACGRSLMVTVVDERSGAPVAHVNVLHGRQEWRFMGILPVQQEIKQGYGQTDANGQIAFKDVWEGDILTVDGGSLERTWFTPLRPVIKTKTGPDTKVADRYQTMNADASPDRLTLPVSPKHQP
jgi:hypothetical protein